MMSPGQWYKMVPTDLDENVQFRLDLLKQCSIDSEFRAGVLEICRQDIIFFINSFVWQFNPKKKGEEAWAATAPFICWQCQIDILLDEPDTSDQAGILWCYEHDKTVVVQKSREMGASWLFLIVQVWLSIFRENHQALDISRNEKMVDSSSPDSLFWKIDFIHKWLPEWLTGPILDQHMHIEYKRSGSFITGEPSTGAAGVGGRGGVAFIDEFPRIKEDVAVRQGTASTAEARFFNGTHQGTQTEFFRMTQTPEIIQLLLHWSQHPDKRAGAYRWNPATNEIDYLDPDYEYPPDYQFVRTGKPVGGPFPGLRSPWYDKKCVDIGSDSGVAQELDINPAGASGQAFDHVLLSNLLRECQDPIWTGDIVKQDDDSYKLVADVGSPRLDDEAGPLKLWVMPDLYGRFPRAVYKHGWDVAKGRGRTNSCGSFLNCDTGMKIGEYANPNIYEDKLAPVAVYLAGLMLDADDQPAEMIWEKQGPGLRFGSEIKDLGFTRFFTNNPTANTRFEDTVAAIPGWDAETKAKNLLLNEYETGLRDRHFMNPSRLAIEELYLFQWDTAGKKIYHTGSLNKNDPTGAGENHGDRGMADALAYKLGKAYITKRQDERAEAEVPVYSYAWRQQHKSDGRDRRGLSKLYQ